MPALWLLAAAWSLRADAPALTLAQASAMPTAQLGDALLAAGHPKIVGARVGVQGMAPPPPPNTPFQSPIELIAEGAESNEPGFCERSVAHILLAPVIFAGTQAPPARPVHLETEQTYRWRTKSNDGSSCAGVGKRYFSVDRTDKPQAFALIRALAGLQSRLKDGREIKAKVRIDDREAIQNQEFARTNKDPRIQPSPAEMTPIVDGRVALMALPLGQISSITLNLQGWHRPFEDKDLIGAGGVRRAVASLFAGREWSVDLVLDQGNIVLVHITHEVPPPF
ncbi:hypothetical protein [Sphingomonas sp.]|uniref:hypothetical protein n=1 Tax=Sphingomonas sp. TaxID=28214 RepID=UPI003B3A77E7